MKDTAVPALIVEFDQISRNKQTITGLGDTIRDPMSECDLELGIRQSKSYLAGSSYTFYFPNWLEVVQEHEKRDKNMFDVK